MSRLADRIAAGNHFVTAEAVVPEDPSIVNLKTELDKMLVGKRDKKWKKTEAFYPSNSSTCKRYQVLLFQGAEAEPKVDGRGMKIFGNGDDVHSRWAGYFKDMGILVETEKKIKINDPVPISGSADGIINWGGEIVYEMKSMNTERFAYRQLYKKPDDDTYRQIQFYLYALEMEKGIVIYENKNTQEYLIFLVERNDEFLKKEFKKREKIWDVFQSGETPKRPYKRESTNCQRCELETYCWMTLDD